MKSKNEYGIIIHTNKYSGNFYREMCAYITGEVGSCGVGTAYIKENPEPMSFRNMIKSSGRKPVQIYETPGYYNDGFGNHYEENNFPVDKIKYPAYQSIIIYFKRKPDHEIREYIQTRALEFSKVYNRSYIIESEIKIIGFSLYTKIVKEEITHLDMKGSNHE